MLLKKGNHFISFILTLIALCSISEISSAKKLKFKKNLNSTVENKSSQPCHCDFCKEICSLGSTKAYKLDLFKTKTISKKNFIKNNKSKPSYKNRRTIIIYMAADNNLGRPFAARNIEQMATIGSNQNVTIVVHLDIRITGNKKITRRYLIGKNQVTHIDPNNPFTQQMDSGNPATLISCCAWAIPNYKAGTYDFFAWNHGTGILEAHHGKIINPMDLFTYNPATRQLDLDRSIGFMDAINQESSAQRGICWDDTTGNYLSNRKLEEALQTICQNYLGGKKFGIIGFDACLMSMVEVAHYIQHYAEVMVGSQEVELGTGWKYDAVLHPFLTKPMNTVDFAQHIVNTYDKTYQTITNDYTLSAINLDLIPLLSKNIDNVANLLIEGLVNQKATFSQLIKESRNKMACTCFDEPTYIDLHHFYKNLLSNTKKINLENATNNTLLKNELISQLTRGIFLIEQLIIANVTGKNLKNARGISIYFPERIIHNSYKESVFVESNSWITFLAQYLFG